MESRTEKLKNEIVKAAVAWERAISSKYNTSGEALATTLADTVVSYTNHLLELDTAGEPE